MPFTPFHFGPGLLVKGIAPRRVSVSAFIAANVVIDLESFYNLQRGAWPIHTRLHTFVGAALAGVATVALLLVLRRVAMCWIGPWVERGGPMRAAEASVGGILVGGMVGALTHPLLDGLMHQDIEPFAPWTAANPLRGVVGLWALHLGCAIAGAVGALVLVARSLGGRERA